MKISAIVLLVALSSWTLQTQAQDKSDSHATDHERVDHYLAHGVLESDPLREQNLYIDQNLELFQKCKVTQVKTNSRNSSDPVTVAYLECGKQHVALAFSRLWNTDPEKTAEMVKTLQEAMKSEGRVSAVVMGATDDGFYRARLVEKAEK